MRDPGGGYRLILYQSASYTPCGIAVHEAPPAGAVAIMHTHPFALGTVNPCGFLYTGTPSPQDQQSLQRLGLATGYFIDDGGIGKFVPGGGERADRISRCGY